MLATFEIKRWGNEKTLLDLIVADALSASKAFGHHGVRQKYLARKRSGGLLVPEKLGAAVRKSF